MRLQLILDLSAFCILGDVEDLIQDGRLNPIKVRRIPGKILSQGFKAIQSGQARPFAAVFLIDEVDVFNGPAGANDLIFNFLPVLGVLAGHVAQVESPFSLQFM